MRFVTLCLLALLVACGQDQTAGETGAKTTDTAPAAEAEFSPADQQEKWKADTALYLYRTLAKYNFDYAAKHYVSDPDAVLALKDGWSLKADSFRVKAVNDEGVVMGFSAFCYPERDVQVYMVARGQRYYVEFGRTLREDIRKSALQPPQPLRQYCYDFKNQPLQGSIMGTPWQADRVEISSMQFASGPRRSIDIVSRDCSAYPDCKYIDEPDGSGFVVGVSSLDLSGNGGNLGNREYVNIAYPNMQSLNLRSGSYRVTHLENGKIRLELAVSGEESVELNGAVEFSLPQ